MVFRKERQRRTLALPPHQRPARMLEVIGPKVSLHHWSEVDIEYARASVVACTL
jgi:hypothetical protein